MSKHKMLLKTKLTIIRKRVKRLTFTLCIYLNKKLDAFHWDMPLLCNSYESKGWTMWTRHLVRICVILVTKLANTKNTHLEKNRFLWRRNIVFFFFTKKYFSHILKFNFSLKIRNNCLTQFTSLPEGVPKQLLDLRCLTSWTTDRVVIILNTPVTNE